MTFLTPADDKEILIKFYKKTKPGGPGWNMIKKDIKIDDVKKEWIVPKGILCMLLGCIGIYSALFSTGYFIYGFIFEASLFLIISIVFSTLLYFYSKKLF